MSAEESTDKIRERAYQLFLERGEEGQHDALSDWLAAERQIEAEENEHRHRGPARLGWHHPHRHTLTDGSGGDLENPT